MGIVINEVTARRDLRRFVLFPYRLYAGNGYWVPPLRFDEMNTLRKDKNPAFEFCEVKLWLAYKDGRIAGRIAGIIHRRYIEKWGNRYARFGWIDFVDDPEVSRALLDTLENWALAKEMTGVHGPLGFSDLDRAGMLVEGFGEVGTMATIYNYPYYPEHLERHGYRKDVDWVEFELSRPPDIPEKVHRMARVVAKRNDLRTVKLRRSKDLLPYAKELFDVLNTCYGDLYGFVPLTEKQIDAYTKQYFGFIRTDCVSVVLDGDDRVAAFAISIPSLSKALQKSRGRLFPFGFLRLMKAIRNNDVIDFCLVGVRPELQGKGVNALMMSELGRIYLENSFVRGETNPELESNTKVHAMWKLFDSRQHKRRRCYIKQLG